MLVCGECCCARDRPRRNHVGGHDVHDLQFLTWGETRVDGKSSPRFLRGALLVRSVRCGTRTAWKVVVKLCAHSVLDAIRSRELPLSILFNRGRLMVLPQAISKATGLHEALTILRLSLRSTIGFGDAENDHELLPACEVGVAVGCACNDAERVRRRAGHHWA